MKEFLALEHYRGRLVFLLLLVAVSIYALGPVQKETKGPLYHALSPFLNEDNYFIQANAKVDKIPNAEKVQINRLELAIKGPLQPIHLKRIYSKTMELHEKGWDVVSLANYWKRGKADEPSASWIPWDLDPADPNASFWLESWKNEVCKDKAICGPGKFIAPDFTTLSIAIFIDAKENEVQAQLRLWKDLSGVKFGHDWKGRLQEFLWNIKYGLWEYDVSLQQPAEGTWYLESWSRLRTGIVFGFFMDSRVKSGIGYLVLLFFVMTCFRFQRRYYWPVWIGTMLVVLFTLGSIWPLHALGMYQTPYTLPPIITDVIVAVSFCIQMMEVLRMFLKIELDPHRAWEKAAQITHPAINIIVWVTLLNFLFFGIYFSNLWRAIEMDTVFLLGTLWALVMVKFFLPALYLYFDKGPQEVYGWRARWCNFVQAGIKWLNAKVIFVAFILLRSRRWRILAHSLAGVSFGIAAILFAQGKFNTVSEPLTYLPANSRHIAAANFANRPRGPGTDAINIFFGNPAIPNCLKERGCLTQLLALQERLQREVPGTRDTFSLGQEVEYQLQEDHDTVFQDLVQEVLNGESDTNAKLPGYLNPPNSGYVLILLYHSMRTSSELQVALDESRRIIEEFTQQHPEYSVMVFGDEVPYFAEVARIFPAQLPQFVWTSLAAIFLFAVFRFISMVKKSVGRIDPLLVVLIGWALAQPFILTTGVIGIFMVWRNIALDMALGAILPTVIACTADSCTYPLVRFFQLLKEGLSAEQAMEQALHEKGESGIIDLVGNLIPLLILTASNFRPVFWLGSFSIWALVICIGWSLPVTLPLVAAGILRKEVLPHGDPQQMDQQVVVGGVGGGTVNL